MSQDDPKNNGKPEDNACEETSRRRFLKEGAAAAVGAIASQAIPAGAQACGSGGLEYGGVILDPSGKPQCCRKQDDSEAAGYGLVMHHAWTDKAYREKLLTFVEGRATDWIWYTQDERNAMIEKTRKALEEHITVDAKELSVVLSNTQFERGVFRMQDPNERILRLPDRLFLTPELDTGAFHAYVIKSHICGM